MIDNCHHRVNRTTRFCDKIITVSTMYFCHGCVEDSSQCIRLNDSIATEESHLLYSEKTLIFYDAMIPYIMAPSKIKWWDYHGGWCIEEGENGNLKVVKQSWTFEKLNHCKKCGEFSCLHLQLSISRLIRWKQLIQFAPHSVAKLILRGRRGNSMYC